MRFIAFDVETTGTVPGVDSIVEIGAVRFIDGVVDAIFSTLVDPQRPIPPGASQVNGITDDMVRGKPLIKNLLDPFADFCDTDVMVAHNAPFDVQFFNAVIKKHESKAPKGTVLDTLAMARKLVPHIANHRLGTLVQHFKIESSGFHRAEEDATYCGKLFIHLVNLMSGPTSEIPLSNLITICGKGEVKFPQIIRQPKQLDLFSMLEE
jgi:DNA polymerase-3 subunit epsilon